MTRATVLLGSETDAIQRVVRAATTMDTHDGGSRGDLRDHRADSSSLEWPLCHGGAEGVQDRRIGRASARAVPGDDALRMVTLDETPYTGWTVTHFHERWQAEHGRQRSYSWTKKTLQAAGHVARAPRRGAHRKKRPRPPLPDMMRHQDGSTPEGCPAASGM